MQTRGTLFLNSEDLDNAQGLVTSFLIARESNSMSQVFIWCNNRYVNRIYLKLSTFLIVMTDLRVRLEIPSVDVSLLSLQSEGKDHRKSSYFVLAEIMVLNLHFYVEDFTLLFTHYLTDWEKTFYSSMIFLFMARDLPIVHISMQNILSCLPMCH